MGLRKYVIRKISALSIIASAAGECGAWRFSFDATDPSKEYLVEETKQDDCAIYHQAMCVLYGENYRAEPDCDKLKDALIYIDFSGTFDGRGYTRISCAIKKAECMLGKEGITLDFGRGPARYLAFERSANMSRNSVLSFVRADLYEPLHERMMLGMKIGKCQLAKLYAYNALMYTSGRRINDPYLLSEKKIIVIDNPKSIVYGIFDNASPEQIKKARAALVEREWHLTPKKDREIAWYSIVPPYVGREYMDVFCDFRNGGFRLLGDILCDLDEMYDNQEIKKQVIRKSDPPELKSALNGALDSSDYKERIVKNCIALLSPPDRNEKRVDPDEAVKCAVALGERRFVLEVLPYSALELALGPAEMKKRRWFGR